MCEIDLSQYCDPNILPQALALHKAGGIFRIKHSRAVDGSPLVQAKAMDNFHFINHPWLRMIPHTQLLDSYGCDCAEGKADSRMCVHCAALVLALELEDMEPAPVPAPIPSVPEPEPKPTPMPTPMPTPEPVPQPMPEEPPVPDPEVDDPRSMEILLGNRTTGEEPVLWLPNDTEQVFHTNMGIIGTMGTGKTQLTKSVVTQLYRSQGDNFNGYPLGILIFDYKGDYNETKKDFVSATDARVLKPYRLPFNPLALHRTQAFKPLLPMRTANEFKDTISKIFNLGVKQRQFLLDCIVKAYANQGILPEDPGTWDRTPPTFDQVYRVFEEESAGRPLDSLTAAMKKIQQFCLFEADPRKAVALGQLLKGVVVIDLSGYDSDIQSLIVAITLDHFYAYMHKTGSSRTDGRFRQQRYFLLVDEADSFMSQDFPSLRKLLKEGREFGVGMILSTQSLTHFVGGEDDYSRYVLTWVVHNVSDLKQKDVEYVFKLPPKSPEISRQYAAIKNLHKHESIIKLANEAPVSIRDRAFWQLVSQ